MTLEARNVTFYYRGKKKAPVLDQFSLSLDSGERVGLKAPSGRGKTTLCRLLAGYEKPVRGEILLDGKPLGSYRGACPVQMVWQHPETVVDPLLRLGTTLSEAGDVEERLKEELEILADYMVEGGDIRSNEKIAKHADWVDSFLPKYDSITRDNVMDILKEETGIVFTHVLEDAGVYKCTEDGRKAFMRFVETL